MCLCLYRTSPVLPFFHCSSSALTREEREANFKIGKEYNIQFQKRANAMEADLQRKIKLKLEAIEALPTSLKEEAFTEVDTLFPHNRRLTTWTPPIPGFDPAKYDLPGAI